MKQKLWWYSMIAAVVAMCAVGCSEQPMSNDVISQNEIYTVTGDSVLQGDFIAAAVSPLEIISNYQSPAVESDSSAIIKFRLSINSRDNELADGDAHYAIVGCDSLVHFGVPQSKPDTIVAPLKSGTKWTLRVDVSRILDSFETEGYFATATGDTIYAEDFHGIWVAGSTAPLTLDFENIGNRKDLKLQPTADAGVYAVTIPMLPKPKEAKTESHSWRIEAPNENYPQYSSKDMLVDALYNMAIDNISSDVRRNGTYRAGAAMDGVWTRDVAYSTYLALAYLDPQRAMQNLKAKVHNDRIVQDSGTGGSWPVATDRLVWAIAAWEVYKVMGDSEWLEYAYTVIRNSIEDDRLVALDRATGLMHGEQSFLNWRSQSYPRWMQPKDIFESMCLSTNVLFAQTFFILADMAEELNVTTDYLDEGKRLKDAINQNLWQEVRGYYSAYLYGGIAPRISPTIDNLGQALSVIFGIAEDGRAETLIERTPFTPFGIPATYPRFADVPAYHNDAVWPFVQAFWNIAAARVGNENALRRGMGAMYRAAALFGTHKDLFVASTGDYAGTVANSDRRLWSAAGNVAMIFRVIAGMEFKPNGIEFNPIVPVCFGGTKRITGFHYRNAVLEIEIDGTGNEIEKIEIDGKPVDDNFFTADLEGERSVHITMKSGRTYSQHITAKKMTDIPAAALKRLDDNFGTIAIYQCEKYATSGTNLIKSERSNNFVEVTATTNTDISIPVMVDAAGTYYIDVKYANGNGPVNSGNRCAIRALMVNTHLQGAIVMPQRGDGEWLNTGFSNMLKVELLSGKNVIQLMYIPPFCENMNVKDNTALIDYVRVLSH